MVRVMKWGIYLFIFLYAAQIEVYPKTLQEQEMNCTAWNSAILSVLVRVQQESIRLRNSRGFENKALHVPINIRASLIPRSGMSLFTAHFFHSSSFKWFTQGWRKWVCVCTRVRRGLIDLKLLWGCLERKCTSWMSAEPYKSTKPTLHFQWLCICCLRAHSNPGARQFSVLC